MSTRWRIMVDIHNHVLWSLDDGAGTMEESLAMLQIARESNITDIVATPHENARYHYQPDLVEERIRALSLKTDHNPKLHRACEFRLSVDSFDKLLDSPFIYTINAKQYLLVECSEFNIGSYTDKVFRTLIDMGLIPIVAHPERISAIQDRQEKLRSWLDMGCLTQITALSLTGGFGETARNTCLRLLEQGQVHFVASDAHDTIYRRPCMSEAYSLIQKIYGENVSNALFTLNPQAVIEGLPLIEGIQTSGIKAKKWYRLWKPA